MPATAATVAQQDAREVAACGVPAATAAMRQKVVVADPAADQKDDQHYIILAGSVVLQVQAVVRDGAPPHTQQQQQQQQQQQHPRWRSTGEPQGGYGLVVCAQPHAGQGGVREAGWCVLIRLTSWWGLGVVHACWGMAPTVRRPSEQLRAIGLQQGL